MSKEEGSHVAQDGSKVSLECPVVHLQVLKEGLGHFAEGVLADALVCEMGEVYE